MRVSICSLVLLFACRTTPEAWADGPRVLHESDSQFNHLVVREEPGDVRTLQFGRDGVIQSRVDMRDPTDLKLKYTRAALLAWALVPDPQRVLIIGLGGGAMPRFFHRVLPATHIDVAELDPAVADVAKAYFALLQDQRLEVHLGDGRKYVQDATAKWDLILLDAYGDSDIPRHLATLEFMNEVKSHLSAKGIVAGNIWARESNVLYDAMAKTWADAFGSVCIVPIEGSGNRIFVASNGVDVSAEAIRAAAEHLAFDFPLKGYAPSACAADTVAAAALHDP